MTTPFRFAALLASALLAIASSGCNCGRGPRDASCTQGADCESGVCAADQRCADRSDAGTTRADAGVLADGGACENLQCQVPSCPGAATTTISGRVFDPAGAVPLYDVIVYVPNRPLAPFTPGPSCDGCGAQVSGAPVAITLTGADGSFTLKNVPSGADLPLVVQVGKWRRQVTLPPVVACQDNPVDASLTRLPRNRSEGDLPQMALASGDADAFECLLRKIGISDSEITAPAGGGRVHFYVQNGMDLAGGAPAGNRLWADAGTLMSYDVVILPCEGAPNAKGGSAVRNLVNYANAGGRVFATHYSYVWTRPGWPQAADWRPQLDDLYDSTFDVTVDQSFPKGQAFAEWLKNVGASPTAGTLGLHESRHDVVSVSAGATRWLYGDIPAATPSASVQHLTFNTPFLDGGEVIEGGPPRCGRVVYSDFHVTAGATDGGGVFPTACAGGPLTDQEKALEFMLFDLSACVQDDHSAPKACAAAGESCAGSAACCAGLDCRDASLNPCSGAGCTCASTIN